MKLTKPEFKLMYEGQPMVIEAMWRLYEQWYAQGYNDGSNDGYKDGYDSCWADAQSGRLQPPKRTF